MTEAFLVIIGGILATASGLVSSLVADYIRSRRVERRWKDERRIEEEKSTIGYFRGIYNAFAPFLALHSRFNHILGGDLSLRTMPPKEQEQANKIRALLPDFLSAYEDFMNKGYAALVPNDLGGKILRYGTKIAFLKAELDEKPKLEDWSDQIFQLVVEVSVIGEEVRSRIRELLNVEPLDSSPTKASRQP